MATAWIENTDCNVCVIDWRPLSGSYIDINDEFISLHNAIKNWNYVKVAMLHTVLTSNSIHRFMEFLKDHGMEIADVSMAGHR